MVNMRSWGDAVSNGRRLQPLLLLLSSMERGRRRGMSPCLTNSWLIMGARASDIVRRIIGMCPMFTIIH